MRKENLPCDVLMQIGRAVGLSRNQICTIQGELAYLILGQDASHWHENVRLKMG